MNPEIRGSHQITANQIPGHNGHEHQAHAVDFLSIDLAVAHAHLKAAEQDLDNPQACQAALEMAREALSTIQEFEDSITDPESRERIRAMANEIEVALARMPS